ncbi:hemin ABC transporter substrate-binding protein [Roseovarius sp. EL26]|uniref:heme/hemin ABC transporter substrate-binding protein n=1 Tax=Roseovarius sp. EL26 TaxID=2126672 RepID=UPI0020B14CD7|nr:ABC transporter substrate-binding protein [Roseovarius sp. EL26]
MHTLVAQADETTAPRVVSIGGAVTEIVFALGKDDTLVARDTTSVYPAQATHLPDVGYMRALAAEGVLSVGPTLILSDIGAGPPETLTVLKDADVSLIMVPEARDGAGIAKNIRHIGATLGASQQAETLANRVQQDLETSHQQALQKAGTSRKKVLFVLSAQGGRIMAAGQDTAAQAMIDLAGGINAVQAFEGYKPMTDEAITLAAPDVILMMDRGGSHDITDEDLFALPALQSTPAAQNKTVLRMNGLYLLGFGPRTADAVADLSAALYGE